MTSLASFLQISGKKESKGHNTLHRLVQNECGGEPVDEGVKTAELEWEPEHEMPGERDNPGRVP